jgi:hypothetical protein
MAPKTSKGAKPETGLEPDVDLVEAKEKKKKKRKSTPQLPLEKPEFPSKKNRLTPEEKAARRLANQEAYRKLREEATAKRRALSALAPPKPPPARTGSYGRPPRDKQKPKYRECSEELVAEFKELVALGISLENISGYPQMPNKYELMCAIADDTSLFAPAYANGKLLRVATLEEEIEDIARTPRIGILKTKRQTYDALSGTIVDLEESKEVEMLEHRRLLTDTLRWQLGYTKPSKHGKNAQGGGESSEQLKGLFESLKAGPVKTED